MLPLFSFISKQLTSALGLPSKYSVQFFAFFALKIIMSPCFEFDLHPIIYFYVNKNIMRRYYSKLISITTIFTRYRNLAKN